MAARWENQHDPECPITQERRDLLAALRAAQAANDAGRVAALEGAVVEYDGGGDQEVEGCTCFMRHRLNDDSKEVV